MTTITLPFENYPAIADGEPKLFYGIAAITLDQPLTYRHHDTKLRLVPTGGLLRWRFDSIYVDGITKDQVNEDDAKAFVRGRYWPKIQPLLYAAFIAESGDPDYAEVFRRLAA